MTKKDKETKAFDINESAAEEKNKKSNNSKQKDKKDPTGTAWRINENTVGSSD